MSRNYDNWERLVGAVLKREQLRRLALCDSADSSIISTASSSTSTGFTSPLPSYDVHESYSEVVRLFPEKITGNLSESTRGEMGPASRIMWLAHINDAAAVREILEEEPSLVHSRNYDYRTPLHEAAILGWVDVAKCLLEFGADPNAQDRWKNTKMNLTR